VVVQGAGLVTSADEHGVGVKQWGHCMGVDCGWEWYGRKSYGAKRYWCWVWTRRLVPTLTFATWPLQCAVNDPFPSGRWGSNTSLLSHRPLGLHVLGTPWQLDLGRVAKYVC